jgi:hypothetical protein
MQRRLKSWPAPQKKDVVMHRSFEFVLEMPKAQKVILMGDFS